MAIALIAWLIAPAPIAWTSTRFWVRTTPAIAPPTATGLLVAETLRISNGGITPAELCEGGEWDVDIIGRDCDLPHCTASAGAMQSLLCVLDAAGLAEHDHLDPPAVAPLSVQALGDLAGHDLGLVIADLVRLDEDTQFLPGKHRKAPFDAVELIGDRLDTLEPLDGRSQRLATCTRPRRADRVRGHHDGRGGRSRLLVVVV